MSFKAASRTDIGRRRSQNQDSYAMEPQYGLFIVADGMGGHKGGEIASAMAVSTIVEHVRAAQQAADWQPGPVIRDAIIKANEAIFARSAQDPSLRGMGTTTTALLFKDHQLIIGHVGDSRAYYFNSQKLGSSGGASDRGAIFPVDTIWQLTRDHSLVQERLRAGLITRAEVKEDQLRNVITRSVGFEEKVNVELYEMKVSQGDTFLLCSDGLSGLAEDPTILAIVQANLAPSQDNANPFERTTEKLVEKANANGGDDNITAVLVQV
jgi:protein phosphatase